MNSGKLDAIVSTTVAEKEISKYLWNSILKIGYSPYYLGVSKKSPELYAELNNAITKILQSDWYYNEKVYLKYNGKTSPAATLIPAIEIIRRSVPFPGESLFLHHISIMTYRAVFPRVHSLSCRRSPLRPGIMSAGFLPFPWCIGFRRF